MKKWEDLPENMRCDEVRPYYEILYGKRVSLFFKRVFDIVISTAMLIILSPVFLILAIIIKFDSPGPVFFRQVRVTQYEDQFKIFKFRTMVTDSEKCGTLVTVGNDNRITRIGKVIRKYRLDEIPQLIDVFRGAMTFVGVRPEVVKYVNSYTPEMRATLLLPAGVTNLTCIYFKDEVKLLENTVEVDKTYIDKVIPEKMYWNLKGLKEYSFWNDIKLMFMTFFAMCGKHYDVPN